MFHVAHYHSSRALFRVISLLCIPMYPRCANEAVPRRPHILWGGVYVVYILVVQYWIGASGWGGHCWCSASFARHDSTMSNAIITPLYRLTLGFALVSLISFSGFVSCFCQLRRQCLSPGLANNSLKGGHTCFYLWFALSHAPACCEYFCGVIV